MCGDRSSPRCIMMICVQIVQDVNCMRAGTQWTSPGIRIHGRLSRRTGSVHYSTWSGRVGDSVSSLLQPMTSTVLYVRVRVSQTRVENL